jgi:hypothetical protein
VAVVVDPLGTYDVAVLVEGRGQIAHGAGGLPSAQEIRIRFAATQA